MTLSVSPFTQQTIPAANTFQPGGTEANRREEQNRAQDLEKARSSDSTRTERFETRKDENSYRVSQQESRAEDARSASSGSSRGTQLDIVV